MIWKEEKELGQISLAKERHRKLGGLNACLGVSCFEEVALLSVEVLSTCRSQAP